MQLGYLYIGAGLIICILIVFCTCTNNCELNFLRRIRNNNYGKSNVIEETSFDNVQETPLVCEDTVNINDESSVGTTFDPLLNNGKCNNELEIKVVADIHNN